MSTLDNSSSHTAETPPLKSLADQYTMAGMLKESFRKMVQWDHFAIAVIIVAFVIVDTLLVFNSPYQHYLYSDMQGYFNRPFKVFNGDEKALDLWVGFAPYYHRILALELTWLNYLWLEDSFHEFILIQNIFLSAVATFALYKIGRHLTNDNKLVGLILAGGYAFSFPHLYYNGFVITEPFVVPVIIISISLLYRWLNSNLIFFCGVLLAIAVGVRPSTGILGLPFGLYIVFHGLNPFKIHPRDWIKIFWSRAVRGGLFSIGFFAVLFTVVAENYRISDGRVKGLTSHSGYNFLLGQSQAHRITSSWDGITYIFVPPSVAHHPEYGNIETNIPIYDSSTFFQQGWKTLEEYPHIYFEHLLKFKYLFFDNLFPASPSFVGFKFIEPFRYIMFYMLVFSPLLLLGVREKGTIRAADGAFYAGIFALSCGALYFFTVTFTYFFDFSYSVYALFTLAAYSVIKHYKKYKKLIHTYVAVVAVLTVIFWIYDGWSRASIDEKVRVKITQSSHPVRNLYQDRNEISSKVLAVDSLEFYEHLNLQHAKLGHQEFFTDFFIDADTKIEVLKDGGYRFTFFVDDGYEVFIDGHSLMGYNGIKRMNEKQISAEIFLTKGTHHLSVKMFQHADNSGLAGYYRRLDGPKKPEGLIFEPKGGRGAVIGEDGEFTKFQYPTELDAKKQ